MGIIKNYQIILGSLTILWCNGFKTCVDKLLGEEQWHIGIGTVCLKSPSSRSGRILLFGMRQFHVADWRLAFWHS